MAFQMTNLANPLPRLFDTEWFCLDERLDDDALLTQEEDEYKFMVLCLTKLKHCMGDICIYSV